jgi:uncharacterized membrane protein SirB2
LNYADLRALHVTCAALSVAMFIFRLLLSVRGIDYRSLGALRWLPHAVDSVLLLSALTLVALSGQYPFVQGWLTMKVLLLPLYIIAAALALDMKRQPAMRRVAGLAACLLLAQIIAVALTRDPFPPLRFIQFMQ